MITQRFTMFSPWVVIYTKGNNHENLQITKISHIFHTYSREKIIIRESFVKSKDNREWM